jgi:RNA polymerase sigma factor (sigma-70 family)
MKVMTTESGRASGTRPDVGDERADRLAACLERAQAGDRSALDEVVRELDPLLWRVARSQGLGVEEAADVVQTAWLALVRRLREIRSPQALTAWLVTAVRREAWHERGRSRRTVPDEDALVALPDPAPGGAERLLTDERDRALWTAVRRLPRRCQELLRIVAHLDRPDYDAVSAALGMPRGSIGPTRGRCLAKLRALLLADPAWEAP